jgi:hypothetical protein
MKFFKNLKPGVNQLDDLKPNSEQTPGANPVRTGKFPLTRHYKREHQTSSFVSLRI